MVWIMPFLFLVQQLLSHQEPVYSPDALRKRIQGTVVLSYRIAKDGSVEEIETVSGYPSLVNAAGTNLATWRFRPASASDEKRRVTYVFELADEGKPASVEFEGSSSVRVTAPNLPVDAVRKSGCLHSPVSFVQAAWNANDFVELSRTACYGRCPVYTVKLFADGRVQWKGIKFVDRIGTAEHRVDEARARALIERFRTSEVWSLCQSYKGPETDHATVQVRVSIDGALKDVADYASSAPRWFRQLRWEIDQVAAIHDYAHGSPLEELLERINGEFSLGKTGVTDLMFVANRHGDLKTLLAAGADVNARDASGWTPLMYAAAGQNAKGIAELLHSGADPKQVSKRGETVLMAGAVGGYFDPALAKLSGNINAQDRNGMTALMYLVKRGDIQLIEAAIAVGADIRIRDKRDRTAFDHRNERSFVEDDLRRLLSGK